MRYLGYHVNPNLQPIELPLDSGGACFSCPGVRSFMPLFVAQWDADSAGFSGILEIIHCRQSPEVPEILTELGFGAK